MKHARQVAKQQAQHAPVGVKVAQVHAAVKSPTNEVASRAAARHTGVMNDQQPKPFDRKTFKDALLQKIAAAAPKTLGEADDFKSSGKLDSVKPELASHVTAAKATSQSDIAQTTAQQPDSAGISEKPVTTLPAAEDGATPAIAAAGAAPKPASDAAVSLQAGPQEIAGTMNAAGVTDEQLRQSNEPSFQSAAAQKVAVEQESRQAPQEFRKQEVGLLAAARTDAQAVASKDVAAMHAVRRGSLHAVAGHQNDRKLEEEQKRAEIATEIEKKYAKTKEGVEKRLKQLDDDVNRTFDAGASAAAQSFEDYVEIHMDRYKEDRYDRIGGGLLWLKDKLLGMPDDVNEFYQAGHDLYVKQMDGVIDQVATLVEVGLREAHDIIDAGHKEIQTYLASLPVSERDVGKKAAAGIEGKFEALEKSVTDKEDQLVDSLAKKYNDNLAKVDARIEEMKAANKGLVDKALDAVVGVIRTIIELKNMLFNVLARAADAIGLIIARPIAFLGNLVDAGKTGFLNFVDHIGEHLKQGFMEWLFGAVAKAGITLPEHFDLKGILSLVLQVLGLTYANIRSRAVRILGEKVVKALETAAEIFKILITEGPAGLWKYIKEKIGDLQTLVVDKIKSFVMKNVLIAGITWLIGLLNPASAFIKACKAIYDIVMFFVRHGKEILDLVNAIIDSITAIARGAIDAAASFVEASLARGIPVAIGFLASLLGVGDISKDIKETIDDIREPINAAIDWVINKAVDIVKAVGGLLGIGDDKKKGPEGFDGKVGEDETWSEAGETHHMWIVTDGDDAIVMMQSDTKPVADQLDEYAGLANKLGDKKKKDVLASIGSARKSQAKLHSLAKGLAATAKGGEVDQAKAAAERKTVKTTQDELVDLLRQVEKGLGLSGGLGTEKNPYPLAWPKRALSGYPIIYVGPATKHLIDQELLGQGKKKEIEQELEPNERANWAAKGEKITPYVPYEQRALPDDSEPVGVAPKWRVEVGMKIAMTESGSTGGGSKINHKFEPFGYRASHEGKDGDHIVERQLGGEDSIENLWPLDAGENRSAGSTLSKMSFEDGASLSDLKDQASKSHPIWFQIVSTL